MSKKMKKVLAIIALVFIGLFTVSFVAFLVDRTLFNGAVGFLALFTGGIGLALFLVIKLSRSNLPTDNDGEIDGGDVTPETQETNIPKPENDSENAD